jgi:hypothetical protein
MAKKAQKHRRSQDVAALKAENTRLKAELKRLHKIGLYNAKHPRRAAPTRYGARIAKFFGDVLSGRASVVTVKPVKSGLKGHKKARELAGASQQSGKGIRARFNKLVVPIRPGETARYAPKQDTVSITQRIGAEKYIRRKVHKKIQSEYDFPNLKPNEMFSIPMYRGNRVEYQQFSQADMMQFWRMYGPGVRKEYKTLGDQFYILTHEFEKPPRPGKPKITRAKKPAPKKAPSKRKSRKKTILQKTTKKVVKRLLKRPKEFKLPTKGTRR